MIDDKLAKCADAVKAALKDTPEYRDYEAQKKAVRQDPAKKKNIERAREPQSRLMELPEDQKNGDYAESLQNEYEELVEDTAVYEYSRAEAMYVTMVQEVLARIIENVDIEI